MVQMPSGGTVLREEHLNAVAHSKHKQQPSQTDASISVRLGISHQHLPMHGLAPFQVLPES